MSEFLPERLLAALNGLFTSPSPKLCVALSGGLDSVVLLHALAQLRSGDTNLQLRAVHVNHQLQKDATQWAEKCVAWAAQLSVSCKVIAVEVTDIKTHGMEAAARAARYAAFQTELEAGEVLLTAHHADDQLETLLIALMRGAGLGGMAAMPQITTLGHAWHARPLLGFTRDELQAWADKQALSYLSDPSNAHIQFDRNYLRHEIIPRLKQRWPAAATTGTRTTNHLSAAQSLLNDYVADDFLSAKKRDALSIAVLRSWSSPRRRAVIRYWLQQYDVLMPSTRVLQALEHDALISADDRVPCTRWGEYAVHRYRDHLHLEVSRRPEHIDGQLDWNWSERLTLPHQLGALCLEPAAALNSEALHLRAASLPSQLTICFRQGGERLQFAGESFHRDLKKLLADAGVLPWWRGRIPLIFTGDQLVAVAGLWVSANFVATGTQPALQLQWLHDEKAVFFDK